MYTYRFPLRFVIALVCAIFCPLVQASVGMAEVDGLDGAGPIIVFYPSSSQAGRVVREPFTLDVAWQGATVPGNRRLIMISHGSPGYPWVHADLARTLVEAGFIVAIPEHFGDNYKDASASGPESWKRRPMEVARAIDAIASDRRFEPLLQTDKIGMFGMSAGGHTALTLAGGRWSPAQLRQHCEAHIGDDFQGCVGLTARLDGGFLDGVKKRVATWIIGVKLHDSTWYSYNDQRIGAIVAGVPFASDFDAASLAVPRVPLGIVTAKEDKWLVPAFHSERVLQVCTACERVAELENAGHGSLLSPLPPNRSGLIADLINDPPGFDRARQIPEVYRKIASFFQRHLLASGLAAQASANDDSAPPRNPQDALPAASAR